ncbi:hypothetical protein HAX54_045348, partial [Datura stramonium]|nr:hypothetical protein [Datura stramonium]
DGTTGGGSRARAYQERAQIMGQADPQPKVVNGVLTVVPTVVLPTNVMMRLLNALGALVRNHGGLPVSQTTLQMQTQVQLNVAAI